MDTLVGATANPTTTNGSDEQTLPVSVKYLGSSIKPAGNGAYLKSVQDDCIVQELPCNDLDLQMRAMSITKSKLGSVVPLDQLSSEIKALLLGTHTACPDQYYLMHKFSLEKEQCEMFGGGGQLVDFHVSTQYELQQTDDPLVFGIRFFNIKNKNRISGFNRDTDYPELETTFTIIREDVLVVVYGFEEKQEFSSRLKFQTDPIKFLRNAQKLIWQREDGTLKGGEPTETNLFYIFDHDAKMDEAQKTFYPYP